VVTEAPAPVPVRLDRALDAPGWPDAVRAFYAARALQPVFVTAGGPRPEIRALVDTIDALEADGLAPAPDLERARALLDAPLHPDSLAQLELVVAGLWLDAARGLSGGRVRPSLIDPAWAVDPPARDVAAALDAAARDDRFVAALTDLRPQHEGYANLREVLARSLSGAGPPPPELVRQLLVNLERWRWLPERLEAPYVLVNIPAQELRLVEACGSTSVHRVILGRTDWQTPLVHSVVTHIVLAPPWRVPGEIMRQEILPQIRADTGYLSRGPFLVYRGRDTRPLNPATIDWWGPDTLRVYLVQEPGPTNPLGRVKLVFKNEFAVFLHDTPAPGLFGATDRALSHGCVRVENALELATRLLQDAPGWDRERLAQVAGEWKTRWIALPHPTPVYLSYFTAWVDADGVLQRREDLYGWDARLAAALGY
jgi:murein L,D-transpeptidase YcbB/YkuD